jgi:HEAT repeat protein
MWLAELLLKGFIMTSDEIALQIQTLKNPDAKSEERNQALNALINGGTEVIVPVLRASREPDSNTTYQLHLSILLPIFGKNVIKPLVSELLSDNPQVRLNAARFLGETGYKEVIPILEQYLLVEEVPFIRIDYQPTFVLILK